MKISIDTNDLLGDETTIREEVIAQVTAALKQHILASASDIIRDTLQDSLQSVVREKTEELAELQLDEEFTERNAYGSKGETTTLRNKIAAILAKECVFKNAHHRSDMNAFSQAITKLVTEEIQVFKKEFNSIVSTRLINECVAEAEKKLRLACGVKDADG